MRYMKKYNLPVDKIKVKLLQAPEMVAALERRDIDAFFLWQPWLDKAAQLVQGAHVLARSGDDGVFMLDLLRLLFAGADRRHAARLAATKALMEATDFCTSNADEAAKLAGKAFRIPEADMKLYMSRMQVPHGDAEGRRAGQFPGRRRAGAGREHHQEDAGLE